MPCRHLLLDEAERQLGIVEPGRELGQGVQECSRIIRCALRDRMRRHLVRRRCVKRAWIETARGQALAEPMACVCIAMAVEREKFGWLDGLGAVQSKCEVGKSDAQIPAVLEAMGCKAGDGAIPTEVGMAVVRLRRNIGPRRARQPLHRMVRLQAGFMQAALVDAADRYPGRIVHASPMPPFV